MKFESNGLTHLYPHTLIACLQRLRWGLAPFEYPRKFSYYVLRNHSMCLRMPRRLELIQLLSTRTSRLESMHLEQLVVWGRSSGSCLLPVEGYIKMSLRLLPASTKLIEPVNHPPHTCVKKIELSIMWKRYMIHKFKGSFSECACAPLYTAQPFIILKALNPKLGTLIP